MFKWTIVNQIHAKIMEDVRTRIRDSDVTVRWASLAKRVTWILTIVTVINVWMAALALTWWISIDANVFLVSLGHNVRTKWIYVWPNHAQMVVRARASAMTIVVRAEQDSPVKIAALTLTNAVHSHAEMVELVWIAWIAINVYVPAAFVALNANMKHHMFQPHKPISTQMMD